MAALKLERLKTRFSFDDLLILPNASSVEPKETKIDSKLTKNIKLKIPIVSSPMDTVTESKMSITLAELGAIGVIHRAMSVKREVEEVKKVKERYGNKNSTVDKNGRLRVIAAIGPFDVKRAKALDKVNVDAILIDCAHGHNLNVIKSTKKIKKEVSCELIVGNIVTKEAVEDWLPVEPSAFRVGIGSGSICSTSTVTGVGSPLASAIADVYSNAKRYDIPIIADGGIRTGGDIVKALALGADSVMVGRLFAGTTESPGKIFNGSLIGLKGKYKLYRGMGSKSVIKSTDRYLGSSKHVAEGVEAVVPFVGSVKNVVEELEWSIKQGMGYVGAKNIKELRKKASFVLISSFQKSTNIIPIETEKWLELKKSV